MPEPSLCNSPCGFHTGATHDPQSLLLLWVCFEFGTNLLSRPLPRGLVWALLLRLSDSDSGCPPLLGYIACHGRSKSGIHIPWIEIWGILGEKTARKLYLGADFSKEKANFPNRLAPRGGAPRTRMSSKVPRKSKPHKSGHSGLFASPPFVS